MCQKWYVLLACDAKATPQILNCDRKMLLVSVLQLEFSSKFLQIEKTDWANIDSKWLDSHRGTYQKPKERFLLFISSLKKGVAPVFFDRHGIKTNFPGFLTKTTNHMTGSPNIFPSKYSLTEILIVRAYKVFIESYNGFENAHQRSVLRSINEHLFQSYIARRASQFV